MSRTQLITGFALILVAATTVLLGSLGGCGSKEPALELRDGQRARQFTLDVDEESLYDGASVESFALEIVEGDEVVEARIRAANARGLKALYFDLGFDSELYAPAGVEPTPEMGTTAELLTLEVLQELGHVHYGQVLIHPQAHEGYSGSGILAVVRFRREPQSAVRVVSVPPLSPASQTLLTKQGGLLQWYYRNAGDYNQDGLVTINDLTPLGVHFEEQSPDFPAPFPVASIGSVVDGNSDGMITINDITPIGANFGSSALGGHNVFESLEPGDYPADPADYGSPSAVPALLNVPFEMAQGETAAERLRFRAFVAGTLVNAYYWIRPSDGSTDGIPSNLTGGDTVAAVRLRVVAPPATGGGTEQSPFILAPGSIVDFELFDPGTASLIPPEDERAEVMLGDPAAGTVEGFRFTGNATYAGQFSVFALFDHKPTNPQRISFYVAATDGENNPPVAVVHVAPTAGRALLQVAFYGGQSYDIDAGDFIAGYEWDFGEGAGFQALSAIETHQYAAPGIYDARFMVRDAEGATDEALVRITVGEASPHGPTGSLSADPSAGEMPLTVTFDASGSTAGEHPIVSYEYDLYGNGAFVPGNASYAHTFNQTGVYRVTAKVTDSAGFVGSAWVDVEVYAAGGAAVLPEAALAVAPHKGPVPLDAVFDLTGSSSGPGITYSLNPGDGSPRYNPAAYPIQPHTYDASGVYVATLQVRNTVSGRNSLPAMVVVEVRPAGSLTAVLSGTPAVGPAPLAVTLDATGSSGGTAPYTYDFDFDNDAAWDVAGNSTGSVSHVYSVEGMYTARVRVTDSVSQTDEDTALIQAGGDIPAGPQADLVATPDCGLAPLDVTLDATGTVGGTPPLSYDFDVDDDGSWEVTADADGLLDHTYTSVGAHTARVRVTDVFTLVDEATAVVNAVDPVAAQLVANPASGGAPLDVTLDATSTTGGLAPYTYAFDFEDDGTWEVVDDATGVAVHQYADVGDYTARVHVMDSCAGIPLTDQATALVEVTDPLGADLASDYNCGMPPLLITFTVNADGGKSPYTYDYDFDGDSFWDQTGDTTGTTMHTYDTVGDYEARVRVSDSCATPQTQEASRTIYVVPQLVPSLVVTPPTGQVPPPFSPTLDATGTTGGLPPYTFDFDYQGDGTWEVTGDTTGIADPIYGRPGSYSPVVRVHDSCVGNGQTQQTSATVTVTRNPAGGTWHISTLAQITGNQNSYTGLSLVGDNFDPPNIRPAVCFFDDVAMPAQGLYYIRATDARGTTWPPGPIQVLAGNLGIHSSLKEVTGKPAIAFFDQGALTLNYIRSADAVGSIWAGPGVIQLVPDAQFAGSWNSLDFIQDSVGGQWWPAISYIGWVEDAPHELRYYGGHVRYVRAGDLFGSVWPSPPGPQIIEGPVTDTYYACTSLEYVDGVVSNWSPGVSYVELDLSVDPPWQDWLKYSISVDQEGDNWSRGGFPMQVEQSPPGPATSLELLSGFPWISWSFRAGPTLHWVEGTAADGSTWNIPVHTPDARLGMGDWSSLEEVGGVLGSSYVDSNTGDLMYVDMSKTTAPYAWNPPEVVDSPPMPGGTVWGTYLIELNGLPAISYYITWEEEMIPFTEVRYAVYY